MREKEKKINLKKKKINILSIVNLSSRLQQNFFHIQSLISLFHLETFKRSIKQLSWPMTVTGFRTVIIKWKKLDGTA